MNGMGRNVMCRYERKTAKFHSRIRKRVGERKLRVNTAKSKLMKGSKDEASGGSEIMLNGETLLQMVKFLYLGVDIAAAGSLDAEVPLGRREIKGFGA